MGSKSVRAKIIPHKQTHKWLTYAVYLELVGGLEPSTC